MLKNRKNSNVHCSQCFVNKLCLSGELTNEEKNALYSLPEKAVNFIESMGNVHA